MANLSDRALYPRSSEIFSPLFALLIAFLTHSGLRFVQNGKEIIDFDFRMVKVKSVNRYGACVFWFAWCSISTRSKLTCKRPVWFDPLFQN